jgi:hypothetical protein
VKLGEGFLLGMIVGTATGVLLTRAHRVWEEDAESLSERLTDYVGELEERISVLEDRTVKSAKRV